MAMHYVALHFLCHRCIAFSAVTTLKNGYEKQFLVAGVASKYFLEIILSRSSLSSKTSPTLPQKELIEWNDGSAYEKSKYTYSKSTIL